MTPTVVFGGYGAFGSHVARELARLGHAVTIAGRDRGRAEAAAADLGPAHRAVARRRDRSGILPGGAGRPDRGRDLRGPILVAWRGPAAGMPRGRLPLRGHRRPPGPWRARAGLGDRYRTAGLTAAYGCSSLPGLSGALALLAREGRAAPPECARVTLFIGNANPKGEILRSTRVPGHPTRSIMVEGGPS